MNAFEECCRLLPPKFRASFSNYPDAEELRLRCQYKPSVIVGGREYQFSDISVSEEDLLYVLQLATGASLHAVASSMRNGYISYRGLRIGICGHAACKDGKLLAYSSYTSLAIRISRELNSVLPEEICSALITGPGNFLLAGAPGSGKSTALRDIIRILSQEGNGVCLVDERAELSYGFSLGPCTDILSDLPKNIASEILLKGMRPAIIAFDEISSASDIDTMLDIAGCGVRLIATAHGISMEDMLKRPLYRRLFSEFIFEKIVFISIVDGKRCYRLERISA